MRTPKILKKTSKSGTYAAVRLNIDGKKKDYYLGKYGTPETERKYRQIVAGYLSGDLDKPQTDNITISYIYNKYLDTIEYSNDSDANNARRTLRYAVECFGESLLVSDFADDTKTIRILTEFQQYLLSIAREERFDADGKAVKKQWTYTGVNRIVKTWLAILRWACRQGLLPFGIYRVLDALKPLNARSGLPRTQEAEAVDDETLLTVFPFMTPTIREMVQIQRGTGMRAKEICDLLVGDIDKSGQTWTVRTGRHKTAAHLRFRYFAFSLEETEILRRRCAGKTDEQHVFSQRENFSEFWALQRANRKTPVQPSQRQREQDRQETRLERYNDFFTERSYAQSLRTACNRARRAGIDVANIAPKSIRHAAYTEYSAKYGVELASKNAGHTSPRMADVYDHSLRLAAELLAKERGLFGSSKTA